MEGLDIGDMDLLICQQESHHTQVSGPELLSCLAVYIYIIQYVNGICIMTYLYESLKK